MSVMPALGTGRQIEVWAGKDELKPTRTKWNPSVSHWESCWGVIAYKALTFRMLVLCRRAGVLATKSYQWIRPRLQRSCGPSNCPKDIEQELEGLASAPCQQGEPADPWRHEWAAIVPDLMPTIWMWIFLLCHFHLLKLMHNSLVANPNLDSCREGNSGSWYNTKSP